MEAIEEAQKLLAALATLFNKIRVGVCGDKNIDSSLLEASSRLVDEICVNHPKLLNVADLYRRLGEMLVLFNTTGCINLEAARATCQELKQTKRLLNKRTFKARLMMIYHPYLFIRKNK